MVYTPLKVVSTTKLSRTQKYYPIPAHSKTNTAFLNTSKLTRVHSYLLTCGGCKGGKQQRTQFQHHKEIEALGETM